MTVTRPVNAKEADRWQTFLAVVLANFDARRAAARAARRAAARAARIAMEWT